MGTLDTKSSGTRTKRLPCSILLAGTLVHPCPTDLFALDLLALGDLNGDGREEFAVADPCYFGCEDIVWILSGAEATVLYKLQSLDSAWGLDTLVGSGVQHLVVTDLGLRLGAYSLQGDSAFERAPLRLPTRQEDQTLIIVPDVSADDWDDFVAADESGLIQALSAGDGRVLWSRQLLVKGELRRFGLLSAPQLDLDRDSVPEVYVACAGQLSPAGHPSDAVLL